MTIKIKCESMKDAEKLSAVCKEFPDEFYLKGGSFCVDPKSTLGILAMMYSARDSMYIDTGDMEDETIPKLASALVDFVRKD